VDAWRDLAAELEHQLRERDPGARVHATVAPSGLLQLVVRTDPTQLAAARALARRYEERARTPRPAAGLVEEAMPRAPVERDVQVLGGHHPKR
jgi:hypothetical protein